MIKIGLNSPNMLIGKSALVGLATGLLATLFHRLLDNGDRWRQIVYANIDGNVSMLLLVCLMSVAAVLLSLFLVKRFAPEASGSGIQHVELTLKKQNRIRWQRGLQPDLPLLLTHLSQGLFL